MAARRIYLVGSAGYPNYGDELVAAQWLRYLAAREPDAEIFLDTPAPGSAEVLLGHLHPNVRFVDTLFQISWAAGDGDAWEVADFAARATRHPGVVAKRAAGVELLRDVEVFHVLGGGYISELWRHHVALLTAGQVMVEEFDVRAAASGLGLVPAAGSATLLDRLTQGYDVVDVRDPESRSLISHAKASETGADAFLEIGSHLFDQRPSPPVMLCLQSDLVDAGVGALVETAVATLDAWGVAGSDIGYVEAIPGPDRRAFDLLEPMLPGMRFYPFTEIWRQGVPARRGQRWLTSRFHLHLVAAAAGAWGVAASIKPGYSDVAHGALLAQGSRWDVIEAGEVAPRAHGDPGFRSDTLDAIVAGKQALAEVIYGR